MKTALLLSLALTACHSAAGPEVAISKLGAEVDPALVGTWTAPNTRLELLADGRFDWTELGNDPSNPGDGDYRLAGAYGRAGNVLHLVGDLQEVGSDGDHPDDVVVEPQEYFQHTAFTMRLDGEEMLLGTLAPIGAVDGVVGRWQHIDGTDYVNADDGSIADGFSVERVIEIEPDGKLHSTVTELEGGQLWAKTVDAGTYTLVDGGVLADFFDRDETLYLGGADPTARVLGRE